MKPAQAQAVKQIGGPGALQQQDTTTDTVQNTAADISTQLKLPILSMKYQSCALCDVYKNFKLFHLWLFDPCL
jgi:hypothetical protein